MDTYPQIQNKLLAAATLLGLDTAINLIQAQRQPILDRLAKLNASRVTPESVVEDFKADAARIVNSLRAKDESQASAVKRKYTKRSSYWRKPVTTAKKATRFSSGSMNYSKAIADALVKYLTLTKTATIRQILTHLLGKKLVRDMEVTTRKQIQGILRGDTRIARAAAGNTYKLRTKT